MRTVLHTPSFTFYSHGSHACYSTTAFLCTFPFVFHMAALFSLPQARALVFSGAPDVPETYNSVMNAIFSAQKAGVLVDCAVLGEPSTFLQQAAYITGERLMA